MRGQDQFGRRSFTWRPLAPFAVAFDARPAWAPDGHTIAFNIRLPGASILAISPGGGAPTVLVQDGRHAAWSPDGKRLAFVRLRER